ncbi:hypothetical protein SCUP234_11794 [Seiridium cupressi]
MYIKLSFLSFLSIFFLLGSVPALPAPGVVEATGVIVNGVGSHNGENAIGDMAIRDDKEHEQDRLVDGMSSESSDGAVTIQPLKISGDYKGFHTDIEVHKDGAVAGGGEYFTPEFPSKLFFLLITHNIFNKLIKPTGGGNSSGGSSSGGGSSNGSDGLGAVAGGSGAAVGHKAHKGSSRCLLPETAVMALLLGLIGLVRI